MNVVFCHHVGLDVIGVLVGVLLDGNRKSCHLCHKGRD